MHYYRSPFVIRRGLYRALIKAQDKTRAALFEYAETAVAHMKQVAEECKQGWELYEQRVEELQTINNYLRCELAECSGRKHTSKGVDRPAKAKEKSAEERQEGMEKNFDLR